MSDLHTLRSSYDRVASEYARRIADELQHKPLDQELLNRFAGLIRSGLVADIGCGPGHVGAYLHGRGVQVIGLDLSAAMLHEARRLYPQLAFAQADMRVLPVADHSWAGIVAFYSLVHTPQAELLWTLRELRRVLRPGGWLLLAFHEGDQTLHVAELWGEAVAFDTFYIEFDAMIGYLITIDMQIEEAIEREPYPDIEYQSRRAYVLARKPLA